MAATDEKMEEEEESKDFVRIYQWLTMREIIEYFGNNSCVARMMAQAALRQLIDGKVMYRVQVALY